MAARSKVDQLPETVRSELERRLIGSAFSGYEGHAAWLAEQGYEIKKSSVHRFGSTFEERCAALKMVTEQARVIVSESPDEDNAVNDALMRLCQEKAYNVLLDLQLRPDEVDFPKLMRAVAEMGKASLQQKKHAIEIAAKRQALTEAARRVDDTAKAQGLSDEAIAKIRDRIMMGIGG